MKIKNHVNIPVYENIRIELLVFILLNGT